MGAAPQTLPDISTPDWPCPLPGGGVAREMALMMAAPHESEGLVLVVPALFDEGNRMRRFTAEVMRRLAAGGVSAVCPDLPGLGESPQPLDMQTPGDWALAMEGAALHFGATHVLAIRGGALVAPRRLTGWRYASVTGASQLRQLLRARILSAREAGREETQEQLMEIGRAQGLELGGYRLGADFLSEFPGCVVDQAGPLAEIAQSSLGGAGLWMRAEPGEDAAQADVLAAIVLMGVGPHGGRA